MAAGSPEQDERVANFVDRVAVMEDGVYDLEDEPVTTRTGCEDTVVVT